MFKIIPLEVPFYVNVNAEKFDIYNIQYSKYFKDENFKRTLAGINNTNTLDLTQRSSWTNNNTFTIKTPYESEMFFEQNKILTGNSYDNYTLLKYNKDDFFKNHLDTKISDNHLYTCLIYVPYYDKEKYVGGDLILNDSNNLVHMSFNPSNYGYPVMIIFSIDMYHEVLPIVSGSRYVYKKPLFVDTRYVSNKIVDALDDNYNRSKSTSLNDEATTSSSTSSIKSNNNHTNLADSSFSTRKNVTGKKTNNADDELCDGYSQWNQGEGGDY